MKIQKVYLKGIRRITGIRLITFIIIILISSVSFQPVIGTHIKNESGDNEIEYYALIIGCVEYQMLGGDIPISEDHLRNIYDSLVAADNWNEENIIYLINENATKNNIIESFNTISNKTDENDVFLFSWRGHGITISDITGDGKTDAVLCPYDTGFDFIQGEPINVFTGNELNILFNKINCCGMYLILEACLSGGLIDLPEGKIGDFEKEFTDTIQKSNDIDPTNKIIITSCHETYASWGFRVIGFPLTTAISKTLTMIDLDRNQDHYLSVEETKNTTLMLFNVYSYVPLTLISILIPFLLQFDTFYLLSNHIIKILFTDHPFLHDSLLSFLTFSSENKYVSMVLLNIGILIGLRLVHIWNDALFIDNVEGELNIASLQ